MSSTREPACAITVARLIAQVVLPSDMPALVNIKTCGIPSAVAKFKLVRSERILSATADEGLIAESMAMVVSSNGAWLPSS